MRKLFDLLNRQVDAGNWWPGESDFEICAGAILTQNTAWTNVEVALENLKQAGMLNPQAIIQADLESLGKLIRPSGYYRTKARYLQAISQWFSKRYLPAQALETAALRAELLGITGVGGETADDILLYVYRRPVFIYDAYGRRLLAAAGFGEYPSYEKAKAALDPLIDEASFSALELAHFHGLIVEAGKIARARGGWEVAYPLLETGQFSEGV